MGQTCRKVSPETELEVIQEERRVEQHDNKLKKRQVEHYVFQVYFNFPSIDCMKLILSSDMASHSFDEYLKHEGDNEYLELYFEADKLIRKSFREAIRKDFEKLYQDFICPRNFHIHNLKTNKCSYLSSTIQNEFANIINLPLDTRLFESHARTACAQIQDETMFILGRYYFGNFLRSKHYTIWRSFEACHAIATTTQDALNAENSHNTTCPKLDYKLKASGSISKHQLPPSPVLARNSSSFYQSMSNLHLRSFNNPIQMIQSLLASRDLVHPRRGETSDTLNLSDKSNSTSSPKNLSVKSFCGQISPFNSQPIDPEMAIFSPTWNFLPYPLLDKDATVGKGDYTLRAFTHFDKIERNNILTGENWLAILLSATEGLPIGFSLSKASFDPKESFPLLFVNKYFEKITEYSRLDVLGNDPRKLLFCKETNKIQINQLQWALESGRSFTSIMTNKMASGRLFRNLLSVKPIYTDMNNYVYVMAMHVDVTEEQDCGESKFKMADDLMNILPDEISTEKELPKKLLNISNFLSSTTAGKVLY